MKSNTLPCILCVLRASTVVMSPSVFFVEEKAIKTWRNIHKGIWRNNEAKIKLLLHVNLPLMVMEMKTGLYIYSMDKGRTKLQDIMDQYVMIGIVHVRPETGCIYS